MPLRTKLFFSFGLGLAEKVSVSTLLTSIKGVAILLAILVSFKAYPVSAGTGKTLQVSQNIP